MLPKRLNLLHCYMIVEAQKKKKKKPKHEILIRRLKRININQF